MTIRENTRILVLAIAIVGGLTAEGYAHKINQTGSPVDLVELDQKAC